MRTPYTTEPKDQPEVTYDLTEEAEAADLDCDGQVTAEEAATVVELAMEDLEGRQAASHNWISHPKDHRLSPCNSTEPCDIME